MRRVITVALCCLAVSAQAFQQRWTGIAYSNQGHGTTNIALNLNEVAPIDGCYEDLSLPCSACGGECTHTVAAWVGRYSCAAGSLRCLRARGHATVGVYDDGYSFDIIGAVDFPRFSFCNFTGSRYLASLPSGARMRDPTLPKGAIAKGSYHCELFPSGGEDNGRFTLRRRR